MGIYIVISLSALIVSVFVFFNFLSINAISLIPIVLALISILQSAIFKSEAKGIGNNGGTAFSTRELDREAYLISMKWHTYSKLAIVPPLLCLSLYFNIAIKLLAAFALYILSYVAVKPLVSFDKKRKNSHLSNTPNS